MKTKEPLSDKEIKEIITRLNNGETLCKISIEYKRPINVLFEHWKNHLKHKI
jgi:hypothetical protein